MRQAVLGTAHSALAFATSCPGDSPFSLVSATFCLAYLASFAANFSSQASGPLRTRVSL